VLFTNSEKTPRFCEVLYCSTPQKKGNLMMLLQKRVGKLMTLKHNIDTLGKLECSQNVASVGRHFHISESSVRTIKRSQAAIRASAEASMPKRAEVTLKAVIQV
jgi:hypothetical protein